MECSNYKANYARFTQVRLSREVWDSPEWSDWWEHFHACRDCFDWTLAQKIVERGYDPGDYPCVHIGDQVTRTCPEHPDPADCPDILISYFARFDEYEIASRTGDSSAVPLRYCPWCGISLPESKRERWFQELTELGFTELHGDDIPVEYWTDAWYKQTKW